MIQEYKRAASFEEAQSLSKKGYVFLAGGTQVNNGPFKKWGKVVEKVVSLDKLGLNELKRENEKLIIGAMVTLQELVDSPVVPSYLKNAASFIPTRSVRNMATIGGNVGANRPDSYIIPSLLASGVQADLADGTRLTVEEYIGQKKEDLILRFIFPFQEGTIISIKESRSQLALPVVSAAVRIKGSENEITEVVIAAGCIESHCLRLSDVEKGLVSGKLSDGPELEDAIARAITPRADIKGSKAYKTYINSMRIADAIRSCIKEERS